eukprot:6667324-Lingulodinium_polyedra.AAC.1
MRCAGPCGSGMRSSPGLLPAPEVHRLHAVPAAPSAVASALRVAGPAASALRRGHRLSPRG